MRVFGPEFEAGSSVLVIGAAGQLINCSVGSVGYLLLMSGNQRRLIKVQIAMAGLSIVVNITLIPLLGIVGAAVAAASVNVISNLWNLSEVRKALHIFPYNRSYLALLIPAFVSGAVVVLLRFRIQTSAHPWIVIPFVLFVSYAVFCSSAVAFALDQDDRMIARGAWTQVVNGLRKQG